MAISPEATRAARAITRHFRSEREARDLPQSAVARSVGTKQGSISALESGGRIPHLDMALSLAWAVGLDLALVADHHLPLLALSADEVRAVVEAAEYCAKRGDGGPVLRAAVDKVVYEDADGEAAA